MKKYILTASLLLMAVAGWSQARTTEALEKQFESSLSLYFYKNTLRMLNQTENKEFDELIKNIEKMKFLMVDKSSNSFSSNEYKKLMNDYQSESYESVMTSRFNGKNFDIYVKDSKGSAPGTIVLVNDSTNLFVLDMIGTVDVSKVGTLFSTIDESTDIGNRIKSFMSHKDKTDKKDKGKEKDNSDH